MPKSKKQFPVVPPSTALEVLSTALQYCERAGLVVHVLFSTAQVEITLPGVTIVPCGEGAKLEVVPPVVPSA